MPTVGVERYQSVPLYLLTDTLTPERYGRDGTIAYLQGHEGSFCRILPATFEEEWLVPERYLKPLADTTVFHHVIFVDRRDQNIATLERTRQVGMRHPMRRKLLLACISFSKRRRVWFS